MHRSRLFRQVLKKDANSFRSNNGSYNNYYWHHYHRRYYSNYNRHNHNNQGAQVSSVWRACAGSCVFYHFYENYSGFHYHTTLAERQQEEPTANEKEKEKHTPWYRRYPTQALERIRSPTMRRPTEYSDARRTNQGPPLDNQTMFYGQCLQRQLYKPQVPYPAWDYNWDGKMLHDWSTLEVLSTPEGLRQSSTTGTTRHIILVRHGQYEEKPFDDRKRVLTPL